MNKSSNKILSILSDRRSEVSFIPEVISDDTIELLFEAATWAPSAFNEQPWRYYLGDRKFPESFNKIYSLLAPGNQEWAKNASILILTAAHKNLSKNGNENKNALHDLGMASFSLAMQAQSIGLVSHFMGGYDLVKAREKLSIPDTFHLGIVIAIGYKGTNENLSPMLLKRATSPRVRKSLSDILIRA